MLLKTHPWHCKVIIVAPVERHRRGHSAQVIHWRLILVMVLEVGLRVAPVIGVEAWDLLLLGVVEDGVGAGPSRGVVEDVRQQGLVQLQT